MSKRLTAQQYEAIAMLIEGKTQTDVAEELGVHRNTVGSWVRDNEAFDKAYMSEIRRLTHRRMPEAIEAMMDAIVEDRSAAMMKIAAEMNGLTTQKHEVNATTSDNGSSSDIDAMKAKVEAFRSGKGE